MQNTLWNILNVFFAETPHHPTKISRSAFVYWGLSVVGCLETPNPILAPVNKGDS